MKSYKEFALIYDDLMNDIDYQQWFEFVIALLEKQQISPGKVLEMACGTGAFTRFLCEEGFDVTCFDLSEDMLSVAYNKLRSYKNVSIFKQNMVGFNLKGKFNVIVSVCDSINYVTDDEDLIKTFNSVYNHLDREGLFLFDINSFYKISELIGDDTFVYDTNDVYYVWESTYDSYKKICDYDLTFFVKDEDDRYFRFEESHHQRAYTIEEIISALEKVGFKKIEVYDNYTFSPKKGNSERLTIACRK